MTDQPTCPVCRSTIPAVRRLIATPQDHDAPLGLRSCDNQWHTAAPADQPTVDLSTEAIEDICGALMSAVTDAVDSGGYDDIGRPASIMLRALAADRDRLTAEVARLRETPGDAMTRTIAKVPVTATLQLPDGRVFAHHCEVEEEYQDNYLSWWIDGNAACDCNRSLFLNREYGLELGTLDESIDDIPCMPCGSTIELLSLTIDGQEVYNRHDDCIQETT